MTQVQTEESFTSLNRPRRDTSPSFNRKSPGLRPESASNKGITIISVDDRVSPGPSASRSEAIPLPSPAYQAKTPQNATRERMAPIASPTKSNTPSERANSARSSQRSAGGNRGRASLRSGLRDSNTQTPYVPPTTEDNVLVGNGSVPRNPGSRSGLPGAARPPSGPNQMVLYQGENNNNNTNNSRSMNANAVAFMNKAQQQPAYYFRPTNGVEDIQGPPAPMQISTTTLSKTEYKVRYLQLNEQFDPDAPDPTDGNGLTEEEEYALQDPVQFAQVLHEYYGAAPGSDAKEPFVPAYLLDDGQRWVRRSNRPAPASTRDPSGFFPETKLLLPAVPNNTVGNGEVALRRESGQYEPHHALRRNDGDNQSGGYLLQRHVQQVATGKVARGTAYRPPAAFQKPSDSRYLPVCPIADKGPTNNGSHYRPPSERSTPRGDYRPASGSGNYEEKVPSQRSTPRQEANPNRYDNGSYQPQQQQQQRAPYQPQPTPPVHETDRISVASSAGSSSVDVDLSRSSKRRLMEKAGLKNGVNSSRDKFDSVKDSRDSQLVDNRRPVHPSQSTDSIPSSNRVAHSKPNSPIPNGSSVLPARNSGEGARPYANSAGPTPLRASDKEIPVGYSNNNYMRNSNSARPVIAERVPSTRMSADTDSKDIRISIDGPVADSVRNSTDLRASKDNRVNRVLPTRVSANKYPSPPPPPPSNTYHTENSTDSLKPKEPISATAASVQMSGVRSQDSNSRISIDGPSAPSQDSVRNSGVLRASKENKVSRVLPTRYTANKYASPPPPPPSNTYPTENSNDSLRPKMTTTATAASVQLSGDRNQESLSRISVDGPTAASQDSLRNSVPIRTLKNNQRSPPPPPQVQRSTASTKIAGSEEFRPPSARASTNKAVSSHNDGESTNGMASLSHSSLGYTTPSANVNLNNVPTSIYRAETHPEEYPEEDVATHPDTRRFTPPPESDDALNSTSGAPPSTVILGKANYPNSAANLLKSYTDSQNAKLGGSSNFPAPPPPPPPPPPQNVGHLLNSASMDPNSESPTLNQTPSLQRRDDSNSQTDMRPIETVPTQRNNTATLTNEDSIGSRHSSVTHEEYGIRGNASQEMARFFLPDGVSNGTNLSINIQQSYSSKQNQENNSGDVLANSAYPNSLDEESQPGSCDTAPISVTQRSQDEEEDDLTKKARPTQLVIDGEVYDLPAHESDYDEEDWREIGDEEDGAGGVPYREHDDEEDGEYQSEL